LITQIKHTENDPSGSQLHFSLLQLPPQQQQQQQQQQQEGIQIQAANSSDDLLLRPTSKTALSPSP